VSYWTKTRVPSRTSPAPKAPACSPAVKKSVKTFSMSLESRAISPTTEHENRRSVSRPKSYSFSCIAQIRPLALPSLRLVGRTLSKEAAYTPNKHSDSFNRCGSSALAHQPLHTNARNDQIHFERGRCHRRRLVATKRLRTFQLPPPHTRWRIALTSEAVAKLMPMRRPTRGLCNFRHGFSRFCISPTRNQFRDETLIAGSPPHRTPARLSCEG
jgi:hypothetical protein